MPAEGDARSAMHDDEDNSTYAVVVNEEEQYSIWLDERELPDGWRREGMVGSKVDCLAHIERVWTDLRPLSLRRWMSERESATHRDNQMVGG